MAAVVEAQSFAKAADALGVTQSAVSRGIGRLETKLGIRLFHRTTRSVRLTGEGERFYAEVAPMLMGIENAITAVSGSAAAVRGRLRVNIDPLFSRLMVAPGIGRFMEGHPELSVEMITRDTLGDLVGEGFDLAVRFGEPPESSLIVRKLLETRILTVASPKYLEKFRKPEHPSDLEKHECIQYRDPSTGRPFEWEFHRGREVVPVRNRGRLLLTDVGTMLSACVSGFGVAQIMELGAQHLLAAGALVEVFPDWSDEVFPLYALYPTRSLPAAKLRAFLLFVSEMAGQQ